MSGSYPTQQHPPSPYRQRPLLPSGMGTGTSSRTSSRQPASPSSSASPTSASASSSYYSSSSSPRSEHSYPSTQLSSPSSYTSPYFHSPSTAASSQHHQSHHDSRPHYASPAFPSPMALSDATAWPGHPVAPAAASARGVQPQEYVSPLQELMRRGQAQQGASNLGRAGVVEEQQQQQQQQQPRPPTKSAIYAKAFALSRSTSVKRRPGDGSGRGETNTARGGEDDADDDDDDADTRSIDLLGLGERHRADEDDEQLRREAQRRRDEVVAQRQRRVRESYTDAGPGPSRFASGDDARPTGGEPPISNAFRDSIASDISFNSITGRSERESMLGAGAGGGGVEEDVASALNRLEERRRRDSIDTVTSSEFAEGGRWGRAWANKADDEESLYSNDNDDDDDEDEAHHARTDGAASVYGDGRNNPGSTSRGALPASAAAYRLSDSDLEGKRGVVEAGRGLGRAWDVEKAGSESVTRAAERQGARSPQPRLHMANAPQSAKLEGIAGHLDGWRERGLHPSGDGSSSLVPPTAGAASLQAAPSGDQRPRAVSMTPSIHDAGEWHYPDARDAGNRDSTATISAASLQSGYTNGSDGSGGHRDGGANVFVWPPTPSGSVDDQHEAPSAAPTEASKPPWSAHALQGQRATIESMPATAPPDSEPPTPRAEPARTPVGPSSMLARGLDSPILGPDGLPRRLGAAGSRSSLRSGHPTGRVPPPAPGQRDSAYADPNHEGAFAGPSSSPTTPSGPPPPLGKFRQNAIAQRNGRESLVSDLDVETLRLDGSSRRSSTSTLASNASSRLSTGTIRYEAPELAMLDGGADAQWQRHEAQQRVRYDAGADRGGATPMQAASVQRGGPTTRAGEAAGLETPRGHAPVYAGGATPGAGGSSARPAYGPAYQASPYAGMPSEPERRSDGFGGMVPADQVGGRAMAARGGVVDAKSQMPPPIRRSSQGTSSEALPSGAVQAGLRSPTTPGLRSPAPPKSPVPSSGMGGGGAGGRRPPPPASSVVGAAPHNGQAPMSPSPSRGALSPAPPPTRPADRSVDTKTGPTAAESFLTLGITHHESGDLSRSAYYFERSAKVEGGCVVGMCMWGMALREGWGARKDPKKGFEWISRAAAKAGEMMSSGDGAVRNKSEAELKAIRSEMKLSVFELGKCFCYGWGVKMDKRMALEYFELAAKLGDVDAQAEAGALLAAGKGGVRKDRKKAAMYYRMAEAQGYDTIGLSWIHKQSLMD